MSATQTCALVLVATLVGACQSSSAAAPAVLVDAEAAAMEQVKASVAKAIGRAQVELGPGDLTQSSVVSVLPPAPGPLEGRSLAKPMIFRLEIEGGHCSLVREETNVRVTLGGLICRRARLP